MAFFLGLSIVSILECFCYCCSRIANKCDEETEDEAVEREKWQQRMNENDRQVEFLVKNFTTRGRLLN